MEVAGHLGPQLPFVFVSFALLLAPIWFFGFGAAAMIQQKVRSKWLRVLLPAILVAPYLLFAVPLGEFHWSLAATMIILPVGSSALLESARLQHGLAWQDVLVLILLVGIHLLRLLEPAWPYPGLAALPKLLLTDIAMYLYLVVRNLEGIGYSFLPTRRAIKVGFREWFYFLPFGIGMGTALHFILFHARIPSPLGLATGVVVTFLLVAVPEEFFFRGILQNLLEGRLGLRIALLVTALLFGLSHYHRGGVFDWKYILLAAIAGIFYGRAWRAHRELLASVITHTAVDMVWSVWFR